MTQKADRHRLVQDTMWTLKGRLGSEFDRHIRILGRMQETICELEKLLPIEMERYHLAARDCYSHNDLLTQGQVSWVGTPQQMPWQWHFKRLRIIFSKGKHRKVDKLAVCNQQQEILGYSERIIPIADKRKSSEPVGLFEKIRQHAWGVNDAFKRQWRCSRGCQPADHQAHLNLDAEAISGNLDVVFILSGSPSSLTPSWHHVQVAPTEAVPAACADLTNTQQSAVLAGIQETSFQQNAAART
ncbi:hypothetical protein N657DRAFT_631220 [Parathielavia appendiculata]|uniref:Uncharacterized protein n=1 Tax=Parathielavia appendiculata TaxID=2587402 RepID=A0AAN6U9B6_9PEZI|nr:hypothetical protein N657DRAFT_631220 [Parathielavia appendiculata]